MDHHDSIIYRLSAVIERRKLSSPDESYTAQLLRAGVGRIGDKLREEAAELADAARLLGDDRAKSVVHEAADLTYHMMVMLAACGLTLHDVEAELTRRFGTSGLAESAYRRRPPTAE